MAILAAFAVPHPPIILPEIGKGEETKIQKTIDAYRQVMKEAAELRPDTVVISSPHAQGYADYFQIAPGKTAHGDFGAFRAPKVTIDVNYDEELVQEIASVCEKRDIPAGTFGEGKAELDHGTMIPLYFLRQFLPLDQVRVVRLGLSGLTPITHYRLGQAIADAAEKLGRRVVYIASGDLSHKLTKEGPYGFAKEGPEFDRLCTDCLAKTDFLTLLEANQEFCYRAAECGLRSFWIMAGALDRKALDAKLLSYEGPFGVGYGVVSFHVKGDDPARNLGDQLAAKQTAEMEKIRAAEDPIVRLARYTVETYVTTQEPVSVIPSDVPPELLTQRAGAFVSLHENGRLRGCIGSIGPAQRSLAEEILHNAVSAASRDPRFDPVSKEELPHIVYSVDVLGPLTPVHDVKKLDAKKYGVLVKSRYDDRRGLLLPNLDGVDTPDQQIAIARSKGDIRPDEPVELWKFEVVRHH